MNKAIRKVERIVSLVLMIFLMASALSVDRNQVHAETKIDIQTTTYDRPDPSKFYTKYYYKNDSGEWTWKWSKAMTEGKMHKYVLNRADGSQQWAYCIEPDKAMGTGYDPVPADEEDYWNALTASQRTGISLVLKFGLQHNKYPAYGHTSTTSTAAYIATQCLVWEFKDGVRKFPDCTLTTVTNSAGETRVPKYTYYNVAKQDDTCFQVYQDILAAMKKYYNGASFTYKSSDEAKANPVKLLWDPVTQKYSTTITDTNGCGLYASELTNALGENYTVTRSGKEYKITKITTPAAIKTVKIGNYKSAMLDGRSGEVQKIWTNSLKQPLMTGSSNPVNLYASFVTEDTGYLQIVKKLKSVPADESVDLSKFKFEIINKSGDTVYSGYPDSAGKMKVRLAVGTYTVREVLTSAQSKKFTSSGDVTVKVTTDNTSTTPVSATVTNTWLDIPVPKMKVQVKINKVMEKNSKFGLGSNGEVKKVVFSLYTREDIKVSELGVIPKNTLMETLSIANEGVNTFDTLLPAGRYYIKETATDSHYVVSSQEYDFRINSVVDGSVQTITIYGGDKITNKLDLGSIHLRKVDSKTKEAVSGAVYGLYKKGVTIFASDNVLMTATTVNGELDFLNVPKGSYQIKERKAPAGYMLNEAPIPVVVDGNNAVVYIETKDTPYEVPPQDFEMPHTGGSGFAAFFASGVVLILAGAWVLSNKISHQ